MSLHVTLSQVTNTGAANTNNLEEVENDKYCANTNNLDTLRVSGRGKKDVLSLWFFLTKLAEYPAWILSTKPIRIYSSLVLDNTDDKASEQML